MSYEFKMPMVAESVVEGEIGRWFVKEGDYVKKDANLVEILTDKVNVEVPSPFEGYVLKIVVTEGQIAKVGDVLLVYGGKGEKAEGVPEEPKEEPKKEAKPEQLTLKEEPETQSVQTAAELKKPEVHILATPAVRRMAREMGIDISQVKGTGPGGRITEEDLTITPVTHTPVTHIPPSPTPQRPTAPTAPTQEEGVQGVLRVREERIPFRGIRRTVAKQMVKSRQTTVSTLHVDSADVTDLVALRNTEKQKAEAQGLKLTYLPFFIKAVVAALKEYPIVNSSLDDEREEIVIKHYYNIGIATNTDQGLIVPVLRDADKKDIWQLAKDIAELAERARSGKLQLADVQGSTFSITNVGSLSGQISFPIINYPEAAILGIQSITKKPVVREDEIVIRDMVNLSLVFDHRIFDGATASLFTSEIIRRLQAPALLFWEEG